MDGYSRAHLHADHGRRRRHPVVDRREQPGVHAAQRNSRHADAPRIDIWPSLQIVQQPLGATRFNWDTRSIRRLTALDDSGQRCIRPCHPILIRRAHVECATGSRIRLQPLRHAAIAYAWPRRRRSAWHLQVPYVVQQEGPLAAALPSPTTVHPTCSRPFLTRRYMHGFCMDCGMA